MNWKPPRRELDPAKLVAIIVVSCLVYSHFHPDGLNILKEIMIATVSGFFGYLARGYMKNENS
ncbi:hypothetical protein V0288_11070 [Pannus brasiliensis CCIBt3594]|uniref:Holin n=1 Tax=Pannus brasiliensis CCIBt3594 TaxID=1427578 RepID=A0AAW9QL50_9CHRO